MKVWLIRHGLTRLSEEKRYQGRLDAGLSPSGRASLHQADFCPDRVYVSPALRVRETAEILFPSSELFPVPGLAEMNFGVFEGRGWWEMTEDPDYRTWVDGGCRGRCPDGEDLAVFSERICAAFETILAEEERQNRDLVVVAHGGTQMAVLERWGKPAREYYQWQTACGCGYLLDYDRETKALLCLDELSFVR